VNDKERGGIQVIARAAQVLRSLESEPDGLSLGEIARRIGLPRSTIQRIVGALVEEQLLMSASLKGGFKLGPALVQLGAAADVGTEKLARPFMLELSRQADETVDLSVLRRDNAVFVDQVQGTQRLAAVSAVGKEFPLHCTANGKALLSLLPSESSQRVLSGPLKRYTQATVIDRSALENELRDVEKTGLAYDLEEHSAGICAVGTAFRDSLGREYSLSIPVPAGRFEGKRQLLTKLLKSTKAELLARVRAL
jgi:DNA-binding IclR family transcriptional regulator